jgi:hypothetical protein
MWRCLVFLAGFSVAAGSNKGAEELVQAAALAKNGKWEVSVDSAESIAPSSVLAIDNYSFPNAPGVAIEGIRYVSLNNAVILTVTGLRTNDLYSVAVRNLHDANRGPLPEVRAGFSAHAMSWVAIGAQELGLRADTVAVGTNGFDLVSGGSQMRDEYDESTFAFERVSGDFDKKVRIELQQPSSEAARAGLMVREVLDEGKVRPLDPFDTNTAFSRYLQVHVNPATTAFTADNGAAVPGNNTFEINFRPIFGITENTTITNNVSAPGSNAWVRLRRVGDVFQAFRGTGGSNWVLLGSFTFPTNDLDGNALPPFSTNVFIGPNYSPEVANIPESSGARRSFLAQFREYGDTGFVPDEPPTLSITRIANQVEIEWDGGGTLQSSTNLTTGIWRDLQAGSPARVPTTNRFEFFRVRVP